MALESRKGKKVAVVRGGDWDSTQAAPRTVSLLMERGYSVTVLCWGVSGRGPSREQCGGFEIIRYCRRVGRAGIRFFLLWPFWWMWLIRRFLAGRFQAVHVMNLECVIPAVVSKSLCGHKIIYDIRDAWGMMAEPWPVLAFCFTRLDRLMAAHVDGLLLSQGMLDRMAKFFGRRVSRRISVVQVLNVPQRDLAGEYRSIQTGGIRLNFSGHINYVRNAAAILELARRRTRVQVDVVGHVRDEGLRKQFEQLPNCRLYGRLPFEQAISLMDQCNLVAVMYDVATEVAVVSSANKMFETMMMSRPYIGSKGCFPGIVALQTGAGWALPYGDPEALIDLVDLLAEDPCLLERASRRGRNAYVTQFRWEEQRENLVALYDHVLSGRGELRKEGPWQRFVGTAFYIQKHSSGGLS